MEEEATLEATVEAIQGLLSQLNTPTKLITAILLIFMMAALPVLGTLLS